jgi:hypothetical protein
MFARKLMVHRVDRAGSETPAPVAWLDSFAMRNFTNDAAFDDTLPTTDGQMEAGFRVDVSVLQAAMERWFRRKGWLRPEEQLRVEEPDRLRGMQPLLAHSALRGG